MQKQYITRKSPISGEFHEMELTFCNNDYIRWQIDGVPIQEAMPYLSADEREFLMTGITAKEWKEAFSDA